MWRVFVGLWQGERGLYHRIARADGANIEARVVGKAGHHGGAAATAHATSHLGMGREARRGCVLRGGPFRASCRGGLRGQRCEASE